MVEFASGLHGRVSVGSGPKVLWIHGYTLSCDIWDELWLRLPQCFHIGIDLPGHGTSPPPTQAQSLRDLARVIGRIAVEQNVQHLIGLSFGSNVALQLAIEFPYAFSTLTLAGVSLTGGPAEPGTPERYHDLVHMRHNRGSGPWMTELWMRRPPAIFAGAAAHPELWQKLVAIVDAHRWCELDTGFVRDWVSYKQIDHLQDLGRIHASVLLIVGENELATFCSCAIEIRRRFAKAQIVFIPQTGHLSMLEAPGLSSDVIFQHLLGKDQHIDEGTMQVQDFKDRARRLILAYNLRDLVSLESRLAYNFQQHSPGLPPSREAFFGFVEASYQAFPNGRFEIEDMIAEGSKVLLRWTFRGLHLGVWPFRPSPPTGKVISFVGMDLWHFNNDGKLAEAWFICDTLGMLTQLGRLPE